MKPTAKHIFIPKNKKAKELGIEIINEEQFLERWK